MQESAIYAGSELPWSLTDVRDHLAHCGAQTELTEWRGYGLVIPQVRVVASVGFLVQVNDGKHVVLEAKELAESYGAALEPDLRKRWARATRRLEIGRLDDVIVSLPEAITVFAGRTTFDPAEPEAQRLLREVARNVDGFLFNNVDGTVWHASHSAG